LGHFPLCYVYWKKYADHEANRGNIDKALEVYERGINGIPHSVDLWMYYCTFFSEKSQDLDAIRKYVGETICFPFLF
jgi:pre-mRNA-processing factor 39